MLNSFLYCSAAWAIDSSTPSHAAGVEFRLAISGHHHQPSETEHRIENPTTPSPSPSTRHRNRSKRIEPEQQAAEFFRGRSPGATRNTTARRTTRRKNVMRSSERRANLEADEWTCEVQADGVRCKGCGGWYVIDPRAKFYPSNWKKHRDRCKAIKLKTGQSIPSVSMSGVVRRRALKGLCTAPEKVV